MAIYTVGYGNRSPEQFIGLLGEHKISLLVDVRSVPRSGYQQEFNRGELEEMLGQAGIHYQWMGELLGGRPDQDYLYDQEGHVDYQACQRDLLFQRGFQKILELSQHQKLALMCSELRPEECHRSRIIGEGLGQLGVEIRHIDQNGALISQEQIRHRLHGGQESLFPDQPHPKLQRSDRPLRPARQ